MNKSGSIRKETDNNKGAEVSVEQFKSDNPGLVPHFSGKLIGAHIWYAQVMVKNSSDLTDVQLIIITSQEEILAGK